MTDKPKCPLKFRLQAFEGGEECDEGCAWLMRMPDTENCYACAFAVKANRGQDYQMWTPANVMEVGI
jgi:hypothetical protein